VTGRFGGDSPIKLHAPLFLALLASSVLAVDVDRASALIVDGTNSFRRDENGPAVKSNGELAHAARDFAAYMARTGRYGHTADDRTPSERAQAAGYAYCVVAENIAYQYRSEGFPSAGALANSFVQGWIDSPGHRANMVNGNLTEIGVGVARDEKGRFFAVQLFGRPRSAAILFEVENHGPQAVSYRFGEQGFRLGARQRRAHTVCSPTHLQIERPAGRSPFSAQAVDGTRYTIRGGAVAVESVR